MQDNDISDQTDRLRALLDMTERLRGYGTWEIDLSGDEVYWSEQMSQLHGYPSQQHPSTLRDWLKTIAADDGDRIDAEIKRIANNGNSRFAAVYRWPLPGADRQQVLEIVGQPILENNEVVGVHGIAHELTSGGDHSGSTGSAETRYGDIISVLPASIAIWKRKGNDFVLTETNHAVNATSAGRSFELIGKCASEIFNDRPHMFECMQDAYEANSVIQLENRSTTTADGVTRDYSTSFIRRDDEMVIFSADITARKEIERALKEKERRYREFFENIQTGLCLLDSEYRISIANPALLKALGYSPKEISGKPFSDLIDGGPTNEENVMAALGSIIPREISLIAKNGSRLYVLATLRSIIDDKATENSLIQINDITALKETERDLISLQRRLHDAEDEGFKKEAALGAVLNHLEVEKQSYQKRLHQRIYRALSPYLEQLKSNGAALSASDVQQMEEDLLTSIDHDIDNFEINQSNLSPKELQICKEIAKGKTSKEISEKLFLSVETVRKHRKSIRRKLRLTHRGANLTTYLRQNMGQDD